MSLYGTTFIILLLVILILLPACTAKTVSARAVDTVPEGTGLSAKYLGDAGLAQDASVLLAEDFETGGIEGLSKRWQTIENKDGKVFALSSDVPAGSAGKHSLQMTVTWGENTTGFLYTQLPRAVDTAFLRYYVKYDKKLFAYHCGTHLGGYNPPTPWPQGDPGLPKGHDWMQVEVMPHGEYGSATFPAWTVACFWPEMKPSAGGQYYGNDINPAFPAPLALDRWQCVEVMVKCNSAPDRADGEMALWLDGKLQMHVKQGTPREQWTGLGFNVAKTGGEPFPGFRWRTSNDLKLNFVWLLYNIMQPNPDTPVSRVWFDHIVVSTQYIGPLAK